MSFDLHNYIFIKDNAMPEEVVKKFLKFCKFDLNLTPGALVGKKNSWKDNTVNKNVRDVKTHILKNLGTKSLTEVHWANYLSFVFTNGIKDYLKIHSIDGPFRLMDIQILKYQKGGHYMFHVDHGTAISRTFSCIFLVNENYEGGDLIFKYPGSNQTSTVEKKQNRLIVWPSNFLFPHMVTPVIEGERYSVVAWAL